MTSPSSSLATLEFYTAYFTADFGTTVGVFVLDGAELRGADAGGGVYYGKLSVLNEGNYLEGDINYRTSAGGVSITGASSDLPVSYSTSVKLKLPLDQFDFHTIQSVSGPVNVRFERIK